VASATVRARGRAGGARDRRGGRHECRGRRTDRRRPPAVAVDAAAGQGVAHPQRLDGCLVGGGGDRQRFAGVRVTGVGGRPRP